MEQEVCVKGGAAWILLNLLTISFTKIKKCSIKFLSYFKTNAAKSHNFAEFGTQGIVRVEQS